MDTNEGKVLFKDEVFQVVGCAIEVNTLGHGLVEKPYENALVLEFGLRRIPFRQQPYLMSSIKATRLVCSFPI
jgi:GxxExxY protein